jgi:hypothetical protein
MMTMKAKYIFLTILLLILTACGGVDTPVSKYSPGGEAWIDKPLIGSQFPIEEIEILAHAASPSGIASFTITINGGLLAEAEPDAGMSGQTLAYVKQTWLPTAPGTYVIEVNALDQVGNPIPPAQTKVTIIGEVAIPPEGTATLTEVAVITPTSTSVAAPCDLAEFVDDLTIPDGTVFQPGESFTKAWRLRNIGSCTWGRDYAVVFVGGDPLGAAEAINLSHTAAPGETLDIAVPMIAPQEAGSYQSSWKLRNPQNEVFSFSNGKPFYASITVEGVEGEQPQGCYVRKEREGLVCVVPCPRGAIPGTPCTP